MDRIYRRQRHVYDVTRKYYLLGRDRLIARLAPPAGSRVLEIGCGTGAQPGRARRAPIPTSRFFGIDISTEMLETARRVVEREGLGLDIRLARADATALRSGAAVRRAGLLAHLRVLQPVDDPGLAGRARPARSTWLAPGGELHVVDFGGQERLPGWFRAGLRQWLGLFHVTPA